MKKQCYSGEIYICLDFTKTLKGNENLAANSFHSEFQGDEDLKDHGLQPGDVVYWKTHQIEDSWQPHWKGLYQLLLTNPCAAKLKGTDSRIHICHFKKSPPSPWT